MEKVARWAVYQAKLEARRDHADPLSTVSVRTHFVSPSGKSQTVDAFWDGGRVWGVRFSPDELGKWTWRSECSDPTDQGLHGQAGSFECVPYEGDNPLLKHGPLKLSENRRYLVHSDGMPFFWLADTAWNGVLLAKEADWNRYLATRNKQGFTAIQFVCTHWRGSSRDATGETAFTGTDRLELNPSFFQRLDAKVAAINEHGLIAAPVVLWALTEKDPGRLLSEEAAVRVARYIVARWAAHKVVWFLGGDGRYTGKEAPRWHRIGRAVFHEPRSHLVTMHPCGQSWIAPDFRNEPWYDIVGYQSGHGDSEQHLRWLVFGPPATGWQKEPARPIINLEPNYEGHPAYHSKKRFTDADVRRAAYWSLLIAPTAGITYGNNHIWVWPYETRVPENHPNIGPVEPWDRGLEMPGIRSMTILKQFFASLPWWQLTPAPELLAEQPGSSDVTRFIAVAKTPDARLIVAYAPRGEPIALNLPRHAVSAEWFHPRTGESRKFPPTPQDSYKFVPPNHEDWVLVVRQAAKQ